MLYVVFLHMSFSSICSSFIILSVVILVEPGRQTVFGVFQAKNRCSSSS